MKRFIFLFIASLVAHYSAMAETILPFVQEGKIWTYYSSNFIYEWEETFSLEGDTVIGSRNCLKLYYTCEFYNQNHLYKGAMYEKSNGNVYIITPGSTTPTLLYDFTSEPGTVVRVGEFDIKIEEKKLVKYRGEYLKDIYYNYYDTFQQMFSEGDDYDWIEGLGILGAATLTCFIDGYGPWFTGGERYLKSCTLNGETIFDYDEYWKTSQIITGIDGFSSVLQTKSDYFDLQGRKVANSRKGIYIKDGKKVFLK